MRHLVILGAGTAGTIAANKLRKKLRRDEWDITIVDQSATHYYQPGFLFLPFGIYKDSQLKGATKKYIPKGVTLVAATIDTVDAKANVVELADGSKLPYDYLVIATGTTPRPDQTPGMDGKLWHDSVQSFYTYEDSLALRDKVELTCVTPLPGAFTKPVAAATLGGMLDARNVALEADYMVESIDEDAQALNSFDERQIPFDLLITVPLNMGAD